MAEEMTIEDQVEKIKAAFADQVQEFATAIARVYGDPEPLVKDHVVVIGSVRFVDGERISVADFHGDNEQDDWVTKGLLVEALDMMRFLQFADMGDDEDEDDE